jgi:hypothetical protein
VHYATQFISAVDKNFIFMGISTRKAWVFIKHYLKYHIVTFHFINAYYGMEVRLHSFLTSALDGGESSTSRHNGFKAGKEPQVHIE